jgi:hypothetical protein
MHSAVSSVGCHATWKDVDGNAGLLDDRPHERGIEELDEVAVDEAHASAGIVTVLFVGRGQGPVLQSTNTADNGADAMLACASFEASARGWARKECAHTFVAVDEKRMVPRVQDCEQSATEHILPVQLSRALHESEGKDRYQTSGMYE